MTLPLYLAFHLLYGTLVGRVLFPRMRAEGEVLGAPLLLALLPVALITAPVGAVLLRYVGGWFLHGWLLGEGSVAYERFHLGLLVLVGLGAGLLTVTGMFVVVAVASRDRPDLIRVPLWISAGVALVVLAADARDVVTIAGTQGRHLWSHPAGLLSVAVVATLLGWTAVVRARFAAVPRPPGWMPPTVSPKLLTSAPALLSDDKRALP